MRARHGVWRVYTLVIFAVLLAAALLDAGLFSVENGYTDNVREVHEPLWLTRLDPLRHAPLELKSVVGGAKSVRRFMHRRLPTLADVVEDRTTATRDFYEPFNLLRVPGAHARAAEQRILAAVTRHVARLRTTTPPSAHEDDTRDNDKDANDSADSHITSTDALAAAAATADGADTTTVVVDYAAKRVPLMAAVAPAAETATATTSPQRTRVRYEDLVRLGKGSKRTTPWRRYDVARTRRTRPPRYAWRKFFIAVNLYKNEDVLPFLTGALVAFLEDEVAPFFDVATSVVVSIYANTSPDLTAVLIREFLIPHLQRAGVQTIYVATHGVCMGYATRQFFHERIEWMACVRNKALEPLYDHGMRLFRHANNNNNNYTAAAKDGGGVPGTNTADDADDDADTLVVLFFNDIFFRAHDVSVLLETVPEPVTWARVPVDGMLGSVVDAPDTPRTSPSVVTPPPPPQQQQQARQGARAAAAGGGDGGGARGTSFDMACGMDFFYTFYDTWVTRDWRGWPLLSWPPYTDDAITREAMQRSQAAAAAAATTAARQRRRDDGDGDDDDGRTARYGIPVKCCWNGVAAIRGSLFLQREGRRQQEEEAQRTSPDAVAVSRATAAPPTHEHPAANDAHADDEERQHAANSTTTPTSPSAAPLRHTSGAMYDAISEAAALHDMLRGLYTRVLLRRLADVRMRWHSVHSYLARIDPRRPRVQPVGAITVPALLSELQADATGLATLPMTALMHVGVDATAANNNTCHRHARDKRVCLVRDDSAYYRASHPALRFRHSFVPSYGITALSTRHGRAHHNTTGAVVVDDVCLSSECLLFCEDVLQAVVLQQRRVPVILMNPNVRVAYEARHFDRITTHRLYTSPLFLRGAVALRALKLWTDKLRCAYHRCHVVPHARRAPFCALCPANEHALQLRDRIGVIVQPPVSTRNDWLRGGGGGGGDDAVLSLTVPTYGGGGVARRALVNVTQLSYMTCFDPGDTHAALLEPLRFVFLSCRLFVCAVALGVLLASWRRHSQARTPRRGSVNGNVMGGSSSSFGGVVVVNGGGGSSSSSSSTRGRRLRWLTSRYGRGSAEHVVRIKAM